MQIDYLVIGQGLAGSLLAWELMQRGKQVIIIDNGKENASLMAAGLINPVTGMRLVKSANVEVLLPAAIDYYQKLSVYFKQSFYVEKQLLRILASEKEVAIYKKRQQQVEYQDYLCEKINAQHGLVSPFGMIKQKQTGYLLTRALLTALKDYFVTRQSYIKAEINYQDINYLPGLCWNKIYPQAIIFCEGHHASHNPWFSSLPFQPVKGEIITATSSHEIPQNIINYGHWFIPLNFHEFRTGATFDWEQRDIHTTVAAKEILFASLKKIMPSLSINSEIRQQAGIRPATLDKQPFLGKHPMQPELVIFNGFGAKGSLQIPWYSQCLADHLILNKPVPEACSIMRYEPLLKS